jgi:acetoacetate decarboxylase
MPYPPAPWKMHGVAALTLRLVDIDRARLFVPADLDIVPVLPGKTLGIVYLAYYAPGSVLTYSELIVCPGLVRGLGHTGFWISHIYVDDENSMAGGREIWGLPKEMAQFHYTGGTKIEVRQGTRLLCVFEHTLPLYTLRLPTRLPTLSVLGTDLLTFHGETRAGVGFSMGKLDVPAESPFAALRLPQGGLAFNLRHMHFTASAPRVIGQISIHDQVIPLEGSQS